MEAASSSPHLPLSQRNRPTKRYAGPHEGIPTWLEPSLLKWRDRAVHELTRGNQETQATLRRRIHRSLRREETIEEFWSWLDEDDKALLDVVDSLLLYLSEDSELEPVYESAQQALELMLVEAGSVFTVRRANGRARLERRVEFSVQRRAKALFDQGRAGQHLEAAWSKIYGRSPDHGTAYREAVRAVEVAVHRVVLPNDNMATLGRAIGEIKSKSNRFEIQLRNQRGISSVETLMSMLELLWHSQWDRHGILDESRPLDVSREEAETAVHLAITLVHWFETGLVKRV